jgi:hypothetical protein
MSSSSEAAISVVSEVKESSKDVSPASGMNVLFKIQKIVDPVFDQDGQPDMWMSWKNKIEVYCLSYGRCYVDVLKSKETSSISIPTLVSVAEKNLLKCKCAKKEDQQWVNVRKLNQMMCVSCGETNVEKVKDSNLESESSQRMNAQIHGLLMTNLSNATFAKYCYCVPTGDGAMLWKQLCDVNQLYTKKLQMSTRQEILNETIAENAEKPWNALAQFIDRLTSKYSKLSLISSDKINEQDMLAVLENSIAKFEAYKDLRSWFKLVEPSTFQEAVMHIRREIVDEKIKEDHPKIESNNGKMTAKEEKYQYADYANQWNNNYRGRGRGGRGHGFERSSWRGGNPQGRGPNFNARGNNPITCFTCGGINHKSDVCPSMFPPHHASQNAPNGNRMQQQYNQSNSNNRRTTNETLFAEELVNAVSDVEQKDTSVRTKSCTIYLDSGASNHIFGNEDMIGNLTQLNDVVCAVVANGDAVQIHEKGEIQLQGFHNNMLTITNVRSCPSFTKNLLSVAQLVNRGLEVMFNQEEAIVCRGSNILIRAKRIQNMFVVTNPIILPVRRMQNSENVLDVDESDPFPTMLWHHRLGHCEIAKIDAMRKSDIVEGMESQPANIGNRQRHVCDGCAAGKSTRAPFTEHSSRVPATTPMMRLFHDNSGAVNIPDEGNPNIKKLMKVLFTEKYLSLIVDDYSGYLIGKPIYTKDESVDHIIETILLEENQTGHRVQIVNADDSGEIRTNRLLEFFHKKGIRRNLTNKATPQHNAPVERAMRTVFEPTRAMLKHANLHNAFWGYAVLAVIYSLNLISTYRDESKSRIELFRGHKPSVKKLRVFGCDAMVNILKKDSQSKVDQNAIPCIFLGYDDWRENGYVFFNPAEMCVVRSRDAIFYEDKFTVGRDLWTSTPTTIHVTKDQKVQSNPEYEVPFGDSM